MNADLENILEDEYRYEKSYDNKFLHFNNLLDLPSSSVVVVVVTSSVVAAA